ncbi:MAG: glycosyltransferase family 2 protein [Bacilli bacterium]|nr:glycosyltransferase family 2 protein [Bacilli bacterium]
MKFSICVPTYNRANIVGSTIKSVLDQTFMDWEMLVVDDGSVDNTEQVIQEFQDKRIKYFKKENGGKHTALNVGISNASGEFFIILDSDDTLVPDCLETMLEYLEKTEGNSLFAGIMGRCSFENGQVIGELFSSKENELSYVDFHYRTTKNYGDCCEAVRTELLKQYRFPEGLGFKFVPERFIFDQIGINHKLICVNNVFKVVTYLGDGITMNAKGHLKKNAEGFLLDCVNKLTVVFPVVKDISIKRRFKMWVKYWVLYRHVKKQEYKIFKVPFLGRVAKMASYLYKL